MTRADLWEKLWGNYIEKLRRIDELKAKGRYGYQLRMPYKSLKQAEQAVLKDFPEAQQYIDAPPRQHQPELGLHTQEEQLQAVDMAADALSRGLDAEAANNLFGIATEVGYLRALQEIAMAEGAPALATIAQQNADALISRFRKLYEMTV